MNNVFRGVPLLIALVLFLAAIGSPAQDQPVSEPAPDAPVATEPLDNKPADGEASDEMPPDSQEEGEEETADEQVEGDESTDESTAEGEGEEAEDDSTAVDLEGNMCVACHASDVWDEDMKHLFVTADHLANDVHWQKGILCQGCHGGNAETTDLRSAHAMEDGFRKVAKPADEPAFCGYCHSDAEKMKSYGAAGATTVVNDFLASTHGQHLQRVGNEQSATCTSCHARHAMRAKDDPASSVAPNALVNTCGQCHQNARDKLLASDHVRAGKKDAQGKTGVLSCLECHHEDPHRMLNARDAHSPVYVNNQVETCGKCHEAAWGEYRTSVHGEGLTRAGLVTTAVCANCHGTHAIVKAANPASQLHPTKVADTCGACHRFIEDRLALSVHGNGTGTDGRAQRAAPGGTTQRKPSCIDCHFGHDLPDPRSARFRNQEPDRCGNCHEDLYARYGMSMHGALTNLGYTEGAKCSDCHGAHDILPLSDPNSRMAPGNRVQTCAVCHANMTPKLASFDPHADHHDKNRSALVYWVYRGVLTFIIVVFGFFGFHAVCWFVRGLFDVRKHGRPAQMRPGDVAYLRFKPFHRVAHTVMVVSFLGLALTGLPRKLRAH